MTIRAAVDGSALGNPGPAGWAWVVSSTCWDAGGWDHGTNNLGELTAVLELLRATHDAGLAEEPLHILADSQYAINVITKWMHGWKKKGWVKGDKKPIANLEVIQEIDRLIAGREVTFEWVRGHTGHPMNERADDLARGAAEIHQKGGVATGGPGFASEPTAFPHDGHNQGNDLDTQSLSDLAGESTRLSPSTSPQATPCQRPHPHDGDLHTAPLGSDMCTHDDSLPADASPTLDAQLGAKGDPPSSSTRIPAPTRSDVLAAQKAIITAWTDANPDGVALWLAPGFERVWPNGSVTETFYGPCPPHMSVSRIHTRTAGNTILTRFQLTWNTGTSLETGTWIPTADGPRLFHHQSTIIAAPSANDSTEATASSVAPSVDTPSSPTDIP